MTAETETNSFKSEEAVRTEWLTDVKRGQVAQEGISGEPFGMNLGILIGLPRHSVSRLQLVFRYPLLHTVLPTFLL